MRVWYHPLINDTIVTMNPRYNILLNEVVWEMLPLGSISQSAYAERTLGIQMFGMCCVLCWRRVHPLSAEPFETSSFKVVSLSDEHSLLKKFLEFQKRGKERHSRFLNQPLLFRKNTTLSKHPQTSSFKVATLSDEHSLLKKFLEFQKRGKERHSRFLNQPLLFRKNTTLSKHPQTSSFKVATLSDEHSLLKKFSEFSKEG
jgi:hypothetical protein